jgi:hypothetical protein
MVLPQYESFEVRHLAETGYLRRCASASYIAGTDKETVLLLLLLLLVRVNFPLPSSCLAVHKMETLTLPAGAALPSPNAAAGMRVSWPKFSQESRFHLQVRLRLSKKIGKLAKA